MNENDVAFAYLSYGNVAGGKKRPLLIARTNDDNVIVYKITTKYENKSDFIQQAYYSIKDLDSAGLKKQSYIDLGQHMKLPKNAMKNAKLIGRLSEEDIRDMKLFKSTIKQRRQTLKEHKQIQKELKTFTDNKPELKPERVDRSKNKNRGI